MASSNLIDALAGSFQVRLYGKPLDGVTLGQATDQGGAPRFSKDFALIEGFRISTRCVRLPFPIFLTVQGEGKPIPAGGECGFTDPYKFWDVLQRSDELALVPEAGEVLTLLESFATRGVSGGISVENPRYENGKLCADVHIWAKISILGQSVKFDERIPVCINIGQPCFTVWEIGWANLKVCYRPPNQICLKLCVGKWGIEKCWEHCESIPFRESDAAA